MKDSILASALLAILAMAGFVFVMNLYTGTGLRAEPTAGPTAELPIPSRFVAVDISHVNHFTFTLVRDTFGTDCIVVITSDYGQLMSSHPWACPAERPAR